MHKKAIVRKPGLNFSSGITTSGLGSPDTGKALEQHAAYCEALRACGLELFILEADERYPDGCFVEDTAVVAGETAIIARQGADSRRGEEERIAEILSQFMQTERIKAPGTLDGGDILRADNHFYIGISGRTNHEGAIQLKKILISLGYTSSEITVGYGLHLKSGIAYLGGGIFITAADYSGEIRSSGIIRVDENDSYSVNCLNVNGSILVTEEFPATKNKIAGMGYDVIGLAMSEFRKMDGGLTCLSILF